MRDELVETLLTELAVEWAYVDELDLATIDQRASMNNQARIDALSEETVDRYVEFMRRGDRFPAIIVRSKGRGEKVIVLAGNHRQTAARRTDSKLAAYVVACADETALRISYEDNSRHGLAPSEAERLKQGQHLVACGWVQAEAARLVGVSANKLNRAIVAAGFESRCRTLGAAIPQAALDKIVESTKSRLMGIRADPVFLAAVHLTDDAELPSDDVQRLVSAVNATRSEHDALEHIRNQAVINLERIQRKAAGATGRRHETSLNVLLRTITALLQIKPDDVAASTLTDQRRPLFAQLRRAGEHIVAIDAAVKR